MKVLVTGATGYVGSAVAAAFLNGANEVTGTGRSAEKAAPLLDRLHKLIEVDLANVEKQMNALGAPWTPGRIPQLPK